MPHTPRSEEQALPSTTRHYTLPGSDESSFNASARAVGEASTYGTFSSNDELPSSSYDPLVYKVAPSSAQAKTKCLSLEKIAPHFAWNRREAKAR